MTSRKTINDLEWDDFGFPGRLYKHVLKTATQGDVENVINTIDTYCYNVEMAMNVGDVKGKILDKFVIETNPSTALELGTYCGYSALRIGRLLKENAKFYTVEANPDFAAVATEIIKFAGLDHKVKILVGKSDEVLPNISKDLGISSFDFVFIDHLKSQYKPDVIMMENLGLLRDGTVIVADNVIYPGCPDYLEYVRNNPKYESTNFLSKLEYSEVEDAIEKSVYRIN